MRCGDDSVFARQPINKKMAAVEPIGKVIIALDHCENSRAAFNWYMKELYVPGTMMILIHCIDLPFMPTRDTFEDQTAKGKEKGLALEKQYVAELCKLGIKSKFLMTYEHPQSFIIEVAKQEKVDLIVLGCGGKRNLSHIIMGSVSQYVLNHAHCAVAICKNGTCDNEQRTVRSTLLKSS